jgi:hypothetical protein
MAVVKMIRASQGYGQDNNNKVAFEYQKTVSALAADDSILIPQDVQNLNVQVVVASGGQGKVQYTNDKVEEVVADTANWIDWDAGVVSANSVDVFYPPTAVRINKTNAPGTLTLSLRAQ